MKEEIKQQLLHRLTKGIEMLEDYLRIGPDSILENVLKKFRKAEQRLRSKAASDLTDLDLPVFNLVRFVADGAGRAIKDWNDPIFYMLGEVEDLAKQLLKEY